jgi:hypothetical protein
MRHLKQALVLAALVATAAIYGKAGMHGPDWLNFTW